VRKIKAKEIAADVHAGLGDSVLMEKYDLSAKQLEGLLRKLVEADLITHMQLYERTSLSDSQITKAFVDAEQAIQGLNQPLLDKPPNAVPPVIDGRIVKAKQQIHARTVVSEISSGLGDDGLMAKYGLSHRGLERFFRKLVDLKLITHDELYRGSSLYRKRIDRIMSRLHPRADLAIKVPIYDVSTGDVGLLRDISERGLRVAGIPADAGDERAFQIPIDMFIRTAPLLIIAECRWVTMKGKNRKYPVAGFELKDVSVGDGGVLKEFIHLLLLSKSGEWQVLDGKPR